MKTLHYEVNPGDGSKPYLVEDGKTLTVGELKSLLSEYPDSMPVLATWEGIYTFFRDGKEYVGEKADWTDDSWRWAESDREACLIFNVDQYE